MISVEERRNTNSGYFWVGLDMLQEVHIYVISEGVGVDGGGSKGIRGYTTHTLG